MKLTLTLLCFLFTIPALASDRKAKAFWNCAKGSCWVITETEAQKSLPVPDSALPVPSTVKAAELSGPALIAETFGSCANGQCGVQSTPRRGLFRRR